MTTAAPTRGRRPAAAARNLAVERRIVRVTRPAVKPMSAEEAALRIENSEQEFLVFRDSSTEKLSVLYRRRDGNFGLVEC